MGIIGLRLVGYYMLGFQDLLEGGHYWSEVSGLLYVGVPRLAGGWALLV